VRIMALPDQFLPHGKPADILSRHGLDAAGLAGAAREAARVAAPKTVK
jgi:deoxyxylulose-5-phosphate synthase